jgi:hypothetical protein
LGHIQVSALESIVDRAIGYTTKIVSTMPVYRQAAIAGLRKLCASLAEKDSDDPAVARLKAYLESLRASGD